MLFLKNKSSVLVDDDETHINIAKIKNISSGFRFELNLQSTN
jgi:hypothetical protein